MAFGKGACAGDRGWAGWAAGEGTNAGSVREGSIGAVPALSGIRSRKKKTCRERYGMKGGVHWALGVCKWIVIKCECSSMAG